MPTIRCEYEKMNAKIQMHYKLRKLANPSRPPLHPIIHLDMDTLSQALIRFSKYLNSNFTIVLMTVTHVKILDRETISNMLYFEVFNRMFVHFHFYYYT